MSGFVTVEMLENKKGSPDGKEVKLYQKGEVYELPSNGKDLLGDKFLDRDLCKKVKKKKEEPEESQEELKTMDEEPEENTGEKSERKTMAQMAKEKLTGKGKDKTKK